MNFQEVLEYLQGETILKIEHVKNKYDDTITIFTTGGRMTITSDKTDCDPEYVQMSFLNLSLFDDDGNTLGAI